MITVYYSDSHKYVNLDKGNGYLVMIVIVFDLSSGNNVVLEVSSIMGPAEWDRFA